MTPRASGLDRRTKNVENHWSAGLISRVRTGYDNVRAKKARARVRTQRNKFIYDNKTLHFR